MQEVSATHKLLRRMACAQWAPSLPDEAEIPTLEQTDDVTGQRIGHLSKEKISHLANPKIARLPDAPVHHVCYTTLAQIG